jgi:hypothetical protein
VRVAQLYDLISNKICASRAGAVDITQAFSEGAWAQDAGRYRRSSPQITTSGGRTSLNRRAARPPRGEFALLRMFVARPGWVISRLAAAFAQLGRLDEAHSADKAGLALNPAFTVSRAQTRCSSRNVRPSAQAVADWVLALEPSAMGVRRSPKEIRKVGKNFPFGEIPDRMFGWCRSREGPSSTFSRSPGKGRRRDDRYCGFVGRIYRRADF